MNGYLLDTNVISEARKARRANPNVLAWLASVDDEALFLSVLVLGEIRRRIERLRQSDPVQARALERWLNGLERAYAERILPITASIAQRWGLLGAIRPISTVDGLLAATSYVHELTLVTRNFDDVSDTGISVVNPFVKPADPTQ